MLTKPSSQRADYWTRNTRSQSHQTSCFAASCPLSDNLGKLSSSKKSNTHLLTQEPSFTSTLFLGSPPVRRPVHSLMSVKSLARQHTSMWESHAEDEENHQQSQSQITRLSLENKDAHIVHTYIKRLQPSAQLPPVSHSS